jgi:hypothetical protein
VPYYIYRVFTSPLLRLEKMALHESFAEASVQAKKLRAEAGPAHDSKVKVIFAENELQAEDLLSQVRAKQPGVVGDE